MDDIVLVSGFVATLRIMRSMRESGGRRVMCRSVALACPAAPVSGPEAPSREEAFPSRFGVVLRDVEIDLRDRLRRAGCGWTPGLRGRLTRRRRRSGAGGGWAGLDGRRRSCAVGNHSDCMVARQTRRLPVPA